MQELIDSILATEKSSQDKIQQTRLQAQKILNAADTYVNEQIQTAHTEAHTLLKEKLKQARLSAQKKRNEILQAAAEQNTLFLEQKKELISDTVKEAVTLITGMEND